MTDDDPELTFVETTPAEPGGGDVINGRAPRPPVRWTLRPSWLAGLLAVVLAAGIGIGYLVGGNGKTRTVAPPPSSPAASTPFPAGSALAELPSSANTCFGLPASPTGLMLGIEIVNNAPQPITLIDLQGVFPLGGLRTVGQEIGQCDDNSTEGVAGHRIEPTATAWITLTVDVLVPCPLPLPVQFRVDYIVDGVPATTSFEAFPDLKNAPYPGCPTPS